MLPQYCLSAWVEEFVCYYWLDIDADIVFYNCVPRINKFSIQKSWFLNISECYQIIIVNLVIVCELSYCPSDDVKKNSFIIRLCLNRVWPMTAQMLPEIVGYLAGYTYQISKGAAELIPICLLTARTRCLQSSPTILTRAMYRRITCLIQETLQLSTSSGLTSHLTMATLHTLAYIESGCMVMNQSCLIRVLDLLSALNEPILLVWFSVFSLLWSTCVFSVNVIRMLFQSTRVSFRNSILVWCLLDEISCPTVSHSKLVFGRHGVELYSSSPKSIRLSVGLYQR